MKRTMIKTLTLLLLSANALAADRLNIGEFSTSGLNGWQQKSFAGNTQYQIITESGKKILKASSDGTASGMVRKIKVDLNKTPILNWSWKINNQLKGINEQSKPGDDYAARVYVIVDGGILPWNSKAMNYVWSSNQNRGTNWNNAFLPKNAKMTAVRGKQDGPGIWKTEKRNVKEDFKKHYGINLSRIDAIAIMTDTDNSKQQASAVYGDIFFTAQ